MRIIVVLIACLLSGWVAALPGYSSDKFGENTFFVLIDNSEPVGKSDFEGIGGRVCGNLSVCVVMFWADITLLPASLPLNDRQITAKIAHYNHNKNTGYVRLLVCAKDGC